MSIKIIGIDPGYAITGWAILEKQGEQIVLIDKGAIQNFEKNFYNRLLQIACEIEKIIYKYKPTQAGMEKLFFNKNVKTAMDVSQVRGAIAKSLLENNIKIYDYTPLQVKQAVVGYGKATKSQVQKMIKMLLNQKEIFKPDDIADAVAVGLCHLYSIRFNEIKGENN